MQLLTAVDYLLDQFALPASLLRLFRPQKTDRSFSISDVHNMLVVDLMNVGDLVLASPFLRELRLMFPRTYISIVVQQSIINLMEHCPYVDEIIPYQRPANDARWRLCLSAFLLAASKLWSRRYDLAINAQYEIDYRYATALVYLSRARWRMGYSESVSAEKQIANPDYDRLYTHALTQSEVRHEVENKLNLISALGGEPKSDGLEVWIDDKDLEFADNYLRPYTDLGKPIVALGIGGSFPSKRWPPSRFAELAQWIADTFEALPVIVGDKRDLEDGESIVRAMSMQAVNTAGLTSLRQCAALLKRSSLFVGNDSGPMHLAAAFGLPIVEISVHPENEIESTLLSPKRYKPWKTRSRILQPKTVEDDCGCARRPHETTTHCILQIEVEDVQAAVLSLMQEMRQESYPQADHRQQLPWHETAYQSNKTKSHQSHHSKA